MRKILIVGGVAGGASAAARLRRLNEEDQIIIFEKDEFISFANCGLPYYIGGVIKERDKLFVQTVEGMSYRFGLDIRVFNEVMSIDRANKTIHVKNLKTGEQYDESYDILILSPGASPFVPHIEGLANAKNVYTLRNIPDTDKLKAVVDKKPQSAVVIGGGFIGVEMAENLCDLGIKTTLIEKAPTIMSAPFDEELSAILTAELRCHGVDVILGHEVVALKHDGHTVVLENGQELDTDFIVLAIGVSPNSKLAKDAGLEIGLKRGIVVDEHFTTSDPSIFAIGDAIEVTHALTHDKAYIPLAWPANRQGRILADHINHRPIHYKGTLGSNVAKVFSLVAASTGLTEKMARDRQMPVDSVIVHRGNHAGYYPNAMDIALKLVFNPETGQIYGAQAVGGDGAEKRIDVIATAIVGGMSAMDLPDLELCYAPPFSSAKDPVNIAGYVAGNVILDGMASVKYSEIDALVAQGALLYDVRTPEEFELGHIQGAINLPLDQLRARKNELPGDKHQPIYVMCQVGQRGYLAQQILKHYGYENVYNLSGGYKTYKAVYHLVQNGSVCEFEPPVTEVVLGAEVHPDVLIDAKGLQCPGPIMATYKAVEAAKPGQIVSVEASDFGFYTDIQNWCQKTNNTLVGLERHAHHVKADIRKEGNIPVANVPATTNNATIVLFSGDYDKAMAAMIIAIGAASMGQNVSIFFTFWGLNALRKEHLDQPVQKPLIENMFGMMMPKGASRLGLSNMNMLGAGKAMMTKVMQDKNVNSLPELMDKARALGVKFTACTMSMDVMGIQQVELIDGIEYGGVATYVADSQGAGLTLFI